MPATQSTIIREASLNTKQASKCLLKTCPAQLPVIQSDYCKSILIGRLNQGGHKVITPLPIGHTYTSQQKLLFF